MNIIVLNCGSSSIKYQVISMPDEHVMAKGLIEKIELPDGKVTHYNNNGDKFVNDLSITDHKHGIRIMLEMITDKDTGCMDDLSGVKAVGHRVVHGGDRFSGSVLIDDQVIQTMEECVDLAPLHNPPNLNGIYAMKEIIPDVPQIGVFDTAYHHTMPQFVYLYGLPYSLYEKYRVRRYGFHGTSHKYVAERAYDLLGLDKANSKIITCHLGNGSSITAIKNGQSFDTSMGLTPIEGLIMGTRCGDIDAGALLWLADKEDLSIQQTSNLINKKSGMLGISGVSSDMRDIENAAEKGNERAEEALEMFAYRVKKYIGAYAAALSGLDAIVFTGGIGENDSNTREKVLKGLEFLGVNPDIELNRKIRSKEAVITTNDSKVKAIVIPTNEELMIARESWKLTADQ